MRGSTMPDIGVRNEMVVLQAIRRTPAGISQTEIVRRSGLSRQAVSQITRRLIERGLVGTHGTRVSGRGKPSTILRIAPHAQLTVGVHLDPAHITVVIVDVLAQVVAKRSLGAPTELPQQDIAAIAEALTQMMDELRGQGWTAADGGDVVGALSGIGIAAPGGMDAAAGILLEPPWLPGWRHVALVEHLVEATGLPAVLDKDTNAALTAEVWAGAFPADETILYIYVGAGVGSAVAGGGVVHRGSTTQAGEIGHLPTGLDGPECQCGRRACLGLYTDASAILRSAQEQGLIPGDPTARVADALAEVVARGQAGQEQARELIARHGRALGEALRTLIGVHDPHRIIIGGPYWGLLENLALPELSERALRAGGGDHGVRITSSTLGDDVGAIGAASLFLERTLSPAGR
ncbi:ROK family transcriptional regulator [Ruania halotolerans]|uniref:ROK family transcriptional regulator n=1 Tax=Ruania halotolerans TaxID=2897773 RepID=UPI001E2E0FBD|nr:ROK family transcriptional regulator [Ruania halotolerans]UFU05522.1 ROK family protein [Ruania halotolerans]